jgi:hypothetical protein
MIHQSFQCEWFMDIFKQQPVAHIKQFGTRKVSPFIIHDSDDPYGLVEVPAHYREVAERYLNAFTSRIQLPDKTFITFNGLYSMSPALVNQL